MVSVENVGGWNVVGGWNGGCMVNQMWYVPNSTSSLFISNISYIVVKTVDHFTDLIDELR